VTALSCWLCLCFGLVAQAPKLRPPSPKVAQGAQGGKPVVVVARSWEEATQLLGKPCVILGSGPIEGGLTMIYMEKGLVLRQDSVTGLILGFSTKK
jgi:hypothetical protein